MSLEELHSSFLSKINFSTAFALDSSTPGISEDLVKLNADIAKNIKYVLGEKEESQESKNEEQFNKEETYD